jgi:hypothetical protein
MTTPQAPDNHTGNQRQEWENEMRDLIDGIDDGVENIKGTVDHTEEVVVSLENEVGSLKASSTIINGKIDDILKMLTSRCILYPQTPLFSSMIQKYQNEFVNDITFLSLSHTVPLKFSSL